ncbi:unnamed protein product [Rhizopus stolonifer]
MSTFLEQPYYYNSGIKTQDDFYIIQDMTPAMTSCCDSKAKQKSLISQMRQRMFNSTSTNIPLPESILFEMTQDKNILSSCRPSLDYISPDPLTYRQNRSEHLLNRMMYCNKMDLSQMSLMRLSKGVFVHQVWQSISPQSSPTLSTIESALYEDYPTSEAPVDNFNFGNMQQTQISCYDMFVPFSYTFGVRYTNPYNAHDIIIRGKLPVWCQTLFLSTCLKQSNIQSHVPIAGLFPFAPHIQVSFTPFNENTIVTPDLTLIYEKFTNEYDDPYSLPGEMDWPTCKKQILDNILICDIPDNVATLLESMANIWAATQGLMF